MARRARYVKHIDFLVRVGKLDHGVELAAHQHLGDGGGVGKRDGERGELGEITGLDHLVARDYGGGCQLSYS